MLVTDLAFARTSQTMHHNRHRARSGRSTRSTTTNRARTRTTVRSAARAHYQDGDAHAASQEGYYRFPVIRGNELFFVCEDDVYATTISGLDKRESGAETTPPRRLTQAHGAVQRLVVSPDGSRVAFACAEDGYTEIYVVDARGGPMKQLTHMGASYARACCFSEDGRRVYFTSSGATAEPNGDELWVVDCDGGAPMRMNLGPVHDFDVRNVNGKELVVLGRNTEDTATKHWDGYAGGAGGEIWYGTLDNLLRLDLRLPNERLLRNVGNVSWFDDEHVAFTEAGGRSTAFKAKIDTNEFNTRIVDCQGFSDSTADNEDIKYFPVRHLSIDVSRQRIVYTRGGDVFVAEVVGGEHKSPIRLPIEWRGPRTQLAKRFVHADDWIEDWDLHPEGLTMMVLVRGQPFTMGIWDGPVLSYPPATKLRSPQSSVIAPLASLAQKSQARVRHGAYLYDGERLVFVSDASGEEDIEVHWEEAERPAKRLGLHHELLGRVERLIPSPEAPLVAIVNHRNSLLIVNVETGEMRTADTSSEVDGIDDLTWSPCGNWLAYTYYLNNERSCIRILDVRNGKVFDATNPVLGDHSPAWDPDGKYLYFLGSRELEPVYDAATFGLNFPTVERPHLIILQKDLRNPLLKELRPPYDTESSSGSDYDSETDSDVGRKMDKRGNGRDYMPRKKPVVDKDDDGSDWSTVDGDSDDQILSSGDEDDDYESDASYYHEDAPPAIEIHIDGLTERVVALPMPISRYDCLCGLEDGRFMVVEYPPSRGSPGSVGLDYSSDEDDDGLGSLISYSIRDLRRSILIHGGVSEVSLSMDRKCMVVEKESDGFLELRVYKAGVRPEEEGSDSEELDQMRCDRRTGLVNLDGRIRVLVDPAREWAQMLGEVYRRLRDDLWTEKIWNETIGDDWEVMFEEYVKVLPKVSTRTEFGDLLREIAAGVCYSHVAITSGDPGRSHRRHSAGYLGADFTWDGKVGGYRILNIVKGDIWDDMRGGVLSKPGVNIHEGDILLSIDRVPLTEDVPPAALLIEKGGVEVLLTVKIDSDGKGGIDEALDRLMLKKQKNKKKDKRDDNAPKKGDVIPVRVRAMHSEIDARYRDMIQKRTERVHSLSDGVVGYLHIPDMESTGYSEFWRHYASEVRKGSLILDLRGNTGGHISELLLAKLSQRALAWDIPRRGEVQVYPSNTPGPLVMLVDQRTGSDAELMAESFRKLGLGRVVGMRTWGGLLAINGVAELIDGSELSLPSQNVLLVDEAKGVDARSDATQAYTNAVENRGVIPDVTVDISPAEYSRREDPQLDTAVREALQLLKDTGAAGVATYLRKIREDETTAAELERKLTRKPWSFSTWAPLPPTKEEEEKQLRAKRRAGRNNVPRP